MDEIKDAEVTEVIPETITESEATEAEANALSEEEAKDLGVDTVAAADQATPVTVVPDPVIEDPAEDPKNVCDSCQ